MGRADLRDARCLWIFLLTVITKLRGNVEAFNLDTASAITHRGQTGSMFGFTVLQYTDKGQHRILVGAPQAQSEQPRVSNGGLVHKCSTRQEDTCEPVVFDSAGPQVVLNPQSRNMEPLDDKSGQWFGASMSTSGPDGPVAVCAPRYVYFSPSFTKREPVGTCYVATDSLTNFTEYSPCRQGSGSSGYHQQGSCQAGFSVAVSRDGSRMFMGAPGTWYWQGQEHSVSLKSQDEPILATVEGPASSDDSYLGYSSVVGEFTGDTNDDIAVGMPRGYNLTGAVILFDQKLRNLVNLTGDGMGSYFGYSLAVGDVNNDRMDDLIVGAPLFVNDSISDLIEVGRVYVFLQQSSHRFSEPNRLDGQHNGGRLGTSVAFAGDLNLDGFGDVAAGAPYAGEDGRGVVYIFMGGKNGMVIKPTQVISGRDIGVHLDTFGFALAGGTDLDDNSYPDLVVGAFKSDRVVVLKTRPVVTVTTLLDMPTTINIEIPGNCTLRNGTRVACFVLNTFVQYSGINVPNNLAIQIETILDSGSKTPRAFFRDAEGQSRVNHTYQLYKGQEIHRSDYVYITNNFRDKLSPIKLEAKYRILDSGVPSQGAGQARLAQSAAPTAQSSRQKRDVVAPVLDQLNSTSVVKTIRIGHKCGADNVCHPKLRLYARESSGVREYVLGKSETLSIDVDVENEGEDAFETMFFLNLPQGMNYIRAQVPPDSPTAGVTCSGRDENGQKVVACDVGNPLAAGRRAKFKVFLEPVAASLGSDVLGFSAKVNSSNEELPSSRPSNALDFKLKIYADAKLQLSGTSLPHNQVKYNMTGSAPPARMEEWQIGETVMHVYELYNEGPSTIGKGQLRIVWPSYRNKQPLLYLMEQPLPSGRNIRCDPVLVNVQNATIDRRERMHYVQTGPTSGSGQARPAGPTATPTRRPNPGSAPAPAPALANTYLPDAFASSDPGGGTGGRYIFQSQNKTADGDWKYSPNADQSRAHVYTPYSNRGGRDLTDSHRDKRQTGSNPQRDEWVDPQMACKPPLECVLINCYFGPLMGGEKVSVQVRSRLWENTVRNLGLSDPPISSKAQVMVEELTHGVKPRTNQFLSHAVVTTAVPANPAQVQAGIPWWMIVVGVLIGLLLLVILVLICWKCGFFRRKRPGVVATNGNGNRGAAMAASNNGSSRVVTTTTTTRNGNGNGASNTPYYAYRYDYADNKYYPEKAPGKHSGRWSHSQDIRPILKPVVPPQTASQRRPLSAPDNQVPLARVHTRFSEV